MIFVPVFPLVPDDPFRLSNHRPLLRHSRPERKSTRMQTRGPKPRRASSDEDTIGRVKDAPRSRSPSAWSAWFLHLAGLALDGNHEAQLVLGEWFLDGHSIGKRVILERSRKRGLHLIEVAAHSGYRDAWLALADCLSGAVGTRRDSRLAIRWYERAARAGVRGAAYNLAMELRVMRQYAKALVWLRRAAAQDDEEAILTLAADEVLVPRLDRARRRRLITLVRSVARNPTLRREARSLIEQLRP